MFFEEETAESKRCKFEAQEFTTLMSYLPNWQELDLKGGKNYDVYMAFLRDLGSTIYLKRIERIYSKSLEYGQDKYPHLQPTTTFTQRLHISI